MPLSVSIQVRFVDFDGMGHVNNSVFLSYCELARMEFFRRHFEIANPTDFPFIIARAEIDYLRPLPITVENVNLDLAVSRIGTKSWDFSYTVSDPGTREVFARVMTVQVSYDYAAGATMEMKPEMREILEQDFRKYRSGTTG